MALIPMVMESFSKSLYPFGPVCLYLCGSTHVTFPLQLHIIELGGLSANRQPFGKKMAEVVFPPNAEADFPVGIQVSKHITDHVTDTL